MAPIARERGALTIVDAVTSFGGHPLDVGAWGIDALLQLLAEVSGCAVRAVRRSCSGRGRSRSVSRAGASTSTCSSSQDYWLNAAEYAPHDVVHARLLRSTEALAMLRRRRARGALGAARTNHRAFVDGLKTLGLSVLPPEGGERLWTLNAVKGDGIRHV